MRKSFLTVALLSAISAPALAAPQQSDHDRIATLEAQLRALQAEIQAMKATAPILAATTPVTSATDEIEALAADAPDIATPAADVSLGVAASDTGTGGGSTGGANAFNPAISIILNGSYSHHSPDPDRYVRAGLPLVGEGRPSANGLSLGESEVALSSNIDDKFHGQLTLAIESEGGLGVEEAFIDTSALPGGLNLRLGRFFSNIGYLNNHHAHTDNFFGRPLVYQAFLGNQYGDDGVQLRWIAPTDLFLEVGGELLRGQNFPSGGAQHGGVGTRTLFAHAGGDVGSESAWLAGVSMLKTRAAGAEDGFSGDITLYIADATWKWAPDGNTKDGGVTVRGEYFLDARTGDFTNPRHPALTSLWNGQRSGAYVEGVYRISRTWDGGYRYDRLWADARHPFASNFDPFRHTAELTWRNSEFSLFRLQLSHEKPNSDDTDNTITLQYQTALGAHGAHKF